MRRTASSGTRLGAAGVYASKGAVMNRTFLRRRLPVFLLPILIGLAGCDIVTADFRSEETAQWHKPTSSSPTAGSRSATSTARSRSSRRPATPSTSSALKKARGASPEAAKAALERATHRRRRLRAAASRSTRSSRASGGIFNGGTLQVEYHVKVPAGAEVKFTTVNGGIEITGLNGRITAETTNGGVTTRECRRPARREHHQRRRSTSISRACPRAA